MRISNKAVDYIIAAEVISPGYYSKYFLHAVWPKGESGITIGIGYDLGYNTREAIANDWKDLPKRDIEALQSVSGIKGEKCIAWLADVRNVIVPFEHAREVFIQHSLPKYGAQALQIYPGMEKLLPDAVGGIVSMIYNRGASIEGLRRVHMKKIVPLVTAMDYAGIATQIEASKVLWVGKHLDGLVDRREKEAALVRNAIHSYSESDSIEI